MAIDRAKLIKPYTRDERPKPAPHCWICGKPIDLKAEAFECDTRRGRTVWTHRECWMMKK